MQVSDRSRVGQVGWEAINRRRHRGAGCRRCQQRRRIKRLAETVGERERHRLLRLAKWGRWSIRAGHWPTESADRDGATRWATGTREYDELTEAMLNAWAKSLTYPNWASGPRVALVRRISLLLRFEAEMGGPRIHVFSDRIADLAQIYFHHADAKLSVFCDFFATHPISKFPMAPPWIGFHCGLPAATYACFIGVPATAITQF